MEIHEQELELKSSVVKYLQEVTLFALKSQSVGIRKDSAQLRSSSGAFEIESISGDGGVAAWGSKMLFVGFFEFHTY